MPLYVYQCSRCKKTVEELQRMGAAPPERPDSCTSDDPSPCPLSKTLTAPHASFVGPDWGGWERTTDGQFMTKTLSGKASDNYGD